MSDVTAPPGHEGDPLVHCLMQMAQADFSNRVPRTFSGDREDAVAYLVNTVAEELGRVVAELRTHQDDLEKAVSTFAEVLSAHAAGDFDARAPRTMDGDPLDVLAFIINNTGEETGRLFEERNRAFAELERTKETEAMARARTAFLANVSHELRTPLTLVLGPLQSVLRTPGEVSGAAKEELEVVLRNAARLARMVNDLLDFTKAEEKRLEPRWQRVDVATIVEEAVADLQPVAKSRDIDLRCEIDSPELAAADRRMFEKIVMNFLGNALKFTGEGGEVVARLRRKEGDLVFSVSDTGIGIAPEDLDKVFERFLQVDSARSRRFEGSGLGLSLAREFARAMGGDASVESEVGRGSTFTVRFPAQGPAEGLAPEDVEIGTLESDRWLRVAALDEPEERTTLNPEPSSASLQGGDFVLVAEDNPDVQRYVRSVLGDVFEVQTVADGAEALRAIERRVPDVIVSDVMMPNMDGFELVRRVKSVPRLARIPIVLLTARAGIDAAVEGLDAGADDYLAKPFAPRELLARVRAAARLRRHAELAVTFDELNSTRREHLEAEKSHFASEMLGRTGQELLQALSDGDEERVRALSGELAAFASKKDAEAVRFGLVAATAEVLGIGDVQADEVETQGDRAAYREALARLARRLELDGGAASLRITVEANGETAMVIRGGLPATSPEELERRVNPPLSTEAASRDDLAVHAARRAMALNGVKASVDATDPPALRLELLFV